MPASKSTGWFPIPSRVWLSVAAAKSDLAGEVALERHLVVRSAHQAVVRHALRPGLLALGDLGEERLFHQGGHDLVPCLELGGEHRIGRPLDVDAGFRLQLGQVGRVFVHGERRVGEMRGLDAVFQDRLQVGVEILERILVETKKVMRYYNERINSDRKIEQLLVVGGGSNVPGIGEYFTENLIIAARVASPWQKLDFGNIQEPPKQFRARYITVAGAASVNPGSIWK